MPRRSSRRHLHPPKPRRPGRRPGAQWQEPAKPTDDDRYSSFPPFFWCEGSLAVTLFFVEHPLQPREDISKLASATLKMPRGSCCVSLNLVPIKSLIGSNFPLGATFLNPSSCPY